MRILLLFGLVSVPVIVCFCAMPWLLSVSLCLGLCIGIFFFFIFSSSSCCCPVSLPPPLLGVATHQLTRRPK